MKFDKHALARMRELCQEIGPEDGADPRALKRAKQTFKKEDRKQRQLAGQAARALGLALAASPDPVLQALAVDRVEVEPGRLRIVVRALDREVSPELALARLRQAGGWLRAELAGAVRRRRVPELSFGWEGQP